MDEMSGGVFSVSNLGMYGITTFTPVVNPPEAAILGVGTIRKQLTRDNKGEIVDREIMDLSLTLDHRLIDGAQGALFLQELALLMEAPLKLLAGG
jgi:pyruvate dehydrogenase E2 component (dihydrolipoamide acetyltransferase)